MLAENHHPDTKTALLDAAERLFAAAGIAESSVRSITREAGANLASVNYHFGSKDGLVQAVFARRLGPLNQRRLDLLDNCRRQPHGRPELGCVLRAFVEPAMIMMTSDDAGDREFIKLLGRMLFEPSPELRAVMISQFEAMARRFNEALGQVFPHVRNEEIAWRFHFMVGALSHTVAGRYLVSHQLECLELPEEEDVETLTARLVGFLASGWQDLGTGTKQESQEI